MTDDSQTPQSTDVLHHLKMLSAIEDLRQVLCESRDMLDNLTPEQRLRIWRHCQQLPKGEARDEVGEP
jgi:hypothetical protein